jgi:DNA-binding transcriptional ArsR family regulator
MDLLSHSPSLEEAMSALSSPRRRRILQLVWEEELSAGDIAGAFDVSWPAVSQNLRVLKQARFVTERRDGTRRLYRANRQSLGPLAAVLVQMWEQDLDRLKAVAEEEATTRGRTD